MRHRLRHDRHLALAYRHAAAVGEVHRHVALHGKQHFVAVSVRVPAVIAQKFDQAELEPVAVDDFGLPVFFDGGKVLFQVDGFVLHGVLLSFKSSNYLYFLIILFSL